VLFATRLITGNNGRLVSSWGHVPQGFAEATLTELICAPEKLDRIVDVEWSQLELHGSIMLVSQWQDVAPHGGSLASPAKQNRRTQPPVELLAWGRAAHVGTGASPVHPIPQDS